VGAALVSLRQVLAVSIVMATAYAGVVAIPLFSDAALRMTAAVNSLAFPGFALVAFLVSRFVRDLASAADGARRRVAELEHDRSRALVHDLLVYLRLDRFAQADDHTREVMIAQAQVKHEQMRSYTALANVEQHAPGANVELYVRSEPDHVIVTVRDDGPGFEAATARQGFGIGQVLGRQLAGVGGTGAVESNPGAGTVVRIIVPLEHP